MISQRLPQKRRRVIGEHSTLDIFAFWCIAKTSAEAKIERARDGLLNSSKLHHQGLPPLYAVLLAPAEVIIYCTAGWIATP